MVKLICAKTSRNTTYALCAVCKRKCLGPIEIEENEDTGEPCEQ